MGEGSKISSSNSTYIPASETIVEVNAQQQSIKERSTSANEAAVTQQTSEGLKKNATARRGENQTTENLLKSQLQAQVPVQERTAADVWQEAMDAATAKHQQREAEAAKRQITAEDLANLKPEAQSPDDVQGVTGSDVLAMAGFGIGTGQAVEAGVAARAAAEAAKKGLPFLTGATALTVAGGVVGILSAFIMGADLREHIEAPGKARKEAITKMQAEMSHIASQLINSKFPNVPPLTEKAQRELGNLFKEWKEEYQDALNSNLELIQQSRMHLIPEDLRKELVQKALKNIDKIMQEATLDYANARMKIYADPNNWVKS